MQALFAPAAAPEIGGGHVLRDLALASALQAQGWRCAFLVPPWGARLVERFAGAPGIEVLPVTVSDDRAVLAVAVEALRPALLVLDDYALNQAETEALARPGLLRLVIDDRADRPFACELLVDPGYGRDVRDYAGLVPQGCEVLAGPAYALLRPQFAAPEPRGERVQGELRRVFVSFGLSDVDAVAARVVERLYGLAPPQVAFDVALASDAPSLPRLLELSARDARVRVHADAIDVAGLMRSADAAVGAGGASTWERCALGLPTLAVVVADNQRAMISAMAGEGRLLAADLHAPGFEQALRAGFEALQRSEVRARLSKAARALCDGRGASRVAEAVTRRFSGAGIPGS